jgi:hypothetical protein
MEILWIFALYDVEIETLELLGHLPYFPISHRAVVNFKDRTDMSSSARKKHLIGEIKLSAVH